MKKMRVYKNKIQAFVEHSASECTESRIKEKKKEKEMGQSALRWRSSY